MTLADYKTALSNNEGIEDVYDIYNYILDKLLLEWHRVPTSHFSIQSPEHFAF